MTTNQEYIQRFSQGTAKIYLEKLKNLKDKEGLGICITYIGQRTKWKREPNFDEEIVSSNPTNFSGGKN